MSVRLWDGVRDCWHPSIHDAIGQSGPVTGAHTSPYTGQCVDYDAGTVQELPVDLDHSQMLLYRLYDPAWTLDDLVDMDRRLQALIAYVRYESDERPSTEGMEVLVRYVLGGDYMERVLQHLRRPTDRLTEVRESV